MIIRPKDQEHIKYLAQTIFSQPQELWAYGSRVTGEAHACSDLDLVVRMEDLKPADLDEFIAFGEALQESNIPIIIQVFDWARLPDSFHQNILKDYVVLFSNLKEKVG